MRASVSRLQLGERAGMALMTGLLLWSPHQQEPTTIGTGVVAVAIGFATTTTATATTVGATASTAIGVRRATDTTSIGLVTAAGSRTGTNGALSRTRATAASRADIGMTRKGRSIATSTAITTLRRR